MRPELTEAPAEAFPARSRALMPAAATCGCSGSARWSSRRCSLGGAHAGRRSASRARWSTVGAAVAASSASTRGLRSLAATDALTGLVNHRSFHEALAAELERARASSDAGGARDRSTSTTSSPINDTHGHPYGDEVLRAVGAALRGAVRAGDTAARIGGEEFALILPGADADTAFAVAERARGGDRRGAGARASSSAARPGSPPTPTTPRTRRRSDQLADSALYWAKRGGKRRTRRFDPEHSPATWTERQRAEIEELLGLDRPVVSAFQPVVSLGTGRVVGYEALARFPGAERAHAPTSGSPRRTAAASAPSSRRPRSAPRSSRSAPVRDPPRDQRQPLGAHLDLVRERACGEPRRDRGRDHRARVRPRRRLARRRGRRPARPRRAGSRSTTPAPATPGSSS